MINLLPPIEKEKRAQEKTLKLVWILGILIVASILCFSLILFSIKFYIADKIRVQGTFIEAERQKNSQVQVLQKKIILVNGTLSKLNNFYKNQFSISVFLEQLSSLIQSDVCLENFSYQSEGSRIILSGFALDIDEAHKFREILREQENFKKTDFTIPDWLQQKGINFRVSFNLEK